MKTGKSTAMMEPRIVQIEPESDLGRALEEADETEILVEMEGVRYRLDRVESLPRGNGARVQDASSDPHDDPLLGLIGMLDEGERTDIARFKDRSLADAADRRGRTRLDPKRVLDIIGIGESTEGSEIARFKDRYLAEAADHRGE